MTVCTGMDSVIAKFSDIIILCAVIVDSADQIQIDHRHIIQRTHFDDRITQITQGVAMNIFLGLIPILLVGHRIVPGTDNRCYEIELGIA